MTIGAGEGRRARAGQAFRLIVIRGGSGGHTYPALATVRALRARLVAEAVTSRSCGPAPCARKGSRRTSGSPLPRHRYREAAPCAEPAADALPGQHPGHGPRTRRHHAGTHARTSIRPGRGARDRRVRRDPGRARSAVAQSPARGARADDAARPGQPGPGPRGHGDGGVVGIDPATAAARHPERCRGDREPDTTGRSISPALSFESAPRCTSRIPTHATTMHSAPGIPAHANTPRMPKRPITANASNGPAIAPAESIA